MQFVKSADVTLNNLPLQDYYIKFEVLMAITKFSMQECQEMALDQATHKHISCFQCVYDTMIIWPRGPEKLKRFCNHMNSVHWGIYFPMEIRTDSHLYSLDINIHRRSDGYQYHQIYQKPTHTNLHLNAGSHHHPSNKHAIRPTLVHRVTALCNKDSLHDKLSFAGHIQEE
jgi:hypothetical protein